MCTSHLLLYCKWIGFGHVSKYHLAQKGTDDKLRIMLSNVSSVFIIPATNQYSESDTPGRKTIQHIAACWKESWETLCFGHLFISSKWWQLKLWGPHYSIWWKYILKKNLCHLKSYLILLYIKQQNVWIIGEFKNIIIASIQSYLTVKLSHFKLSQDGFVCII